MTPPIEVPWPPMNLVAECTTMSAPHSSGRMQPRRGDGVVDDQRHAVLVGDRRHALDVEHVVAGVADGLAVEGLGVRPHRGPPRVEVVGVVDEGHVDAQLRQRVVEAGCRCRRRGRRRTRCGCPASARFRMARVSAAWPRGHGERTGDADGGLGAALEAGDAGLEDPLGRVHDPGVDVADLGQREQVGGVVGVAELVGRSSGRSGRPGHRWSGPAPGPAWIWRVSKPHCSLIASPVGGRGHIDDRVTTVAEPRTPNPDQTSRI